MGVLGAYNNLLFPDEEKDLPQEIQNRAHIVLGRNEDGSVRYFDRLGMVSDFLEWFGLDAPRQYVKAYLNGEMTVKDIAVDMVKSPINKVAQAFGPQYKTPAEIAMGKSMYPNVFRPRRIRDRGEYIAGQFSARDEYNKVMGKPARKLKSYAEGLVEYTIDPDEAAYYDILDAKDKFTTKLGKGRGYGESPKSDALYYYKKALIFDDKPAADRYLKKYEELGGTPEGLEKSIATFDPLFGLKDEEQDDFVASLSPDLAPKLEKAQRFYERLKDANGAAGSLESSRPSRSSRKIRTAR
jgi:hypothetical protein